MDARNVSNCKSDLQYHSRWLILVSFDRPHMISHYFPIVTTSLSCTVSELLSVISQKLKRDPEHIHSAPISCHITPVLRSLHWLINERIEYKLLSLTYKVLTTNQPPYLHHLISVQPPRSTRSSSLVTLARLPTSSSLRITDRSFRYASPCL